MIAALAERVGLTSSETAVLTARVVGTTAASTPNALGRTDRAVRALNERIMAKTGDDFMHELVDELLRKALNA